MYYIRHYPRAFASDRLLELDEVQRPFESKFDEWTTEQSVCKLAALF